MPSAFHHGFCVYTLREQKAEKETGRRAEHMYVHSQMCTPLQDSSLC